MTNSVGGVYRANALQFWPKNKMFIRGLQEFEWLGPLQAAQRDEQKDSHSFALEIVTVIFSLDFFSDALTIQLSRLQSPSSSAKLELMISQGFQNS